MRKTIEIQSDRIVPPVEQILKHQGIPDTAAITGKTAELARESLSVLMVLARPAALMLEVSHDEFARIHRGEGKNADPNPLDEIFEKADDLALFAVTLGEDICCEVGRLFDSNDYAAAAMLDAAASVGTERLASELEKYYCDYLESKGLFGSSQRVLQFSPGYCGWHMTGQRQLFKKLKPQEIGIKLSKSCLMTPLKSISGVLVAGHESIFEFEDDFDFCDECRTRSCRSRIQHLRHT